MDTLILRAASTTNVDTSIVQPQIDGVNLVNGELVLLAGQTSGPGKNGIYVYTSGASGTSGFLTVPSPTYAPSAIGGLSVAATAGTTNARTQWMIQTDNDGTGYKVNVGKIPGWVVEHVEPGIDYNGVAPATTIIQRAINHALQYSEGNGADSYFQATDITVSGTLSISEANAGTLFRITPSPVGSTVSVSLVAPTDSPADFSVYFALMDKGIVQFSGLLPADNHISSGQQLIGRFQGARANWKTSGAKWAANDAPVTGGGNVYLPGGTLLIDGVGIKLHPAVNLRGQNLGTTILTAKTGSGGLSGTSDITGQDASLLEVLPRAIDSSGTSTKMYNPTIEHLTIYTTDNVTPIDGISFQDGSYDPYYPASASYSGSSANVIDCLVQGWGKMGVSVSPDRQRFFCEGLRCLGNLKGGIAINGNDPVVGPRSGFGSNGGTQVQITDCSGVIMTGVNVWDGASYSTGRSASNIACEIKNVNGATISGCKFNDTLSITVGTDPDKGSNRNRFTPIVISGCEFNPNDHVFDGSGNPNGTTPKSDYDAFIRVCGVQNVHIAGNNFAASGTNNSPWACYAFIVAVSADSKFHVPAEVTFTGSIRSGMNITGPDGVSYNGNYRIAPVHIGTDTHNASPGYITYDLRDLRTGACTMSREGYTSSSADMRGVRATDIDSSLYAGYTAVDAGPTLQLSSPELAEPGAVMFVTVSSSAPVNVPASVRYLFLNKSGTSSVTINLQPGITHIANDAPITVVFRDSFTTVSWNFNGGAFPWASGDAPTATLGPHTSIELLFQGSPTPTYYRTWVSV